MYTQLTYIYIFSQAKWFGIAHKTFNRIYMHIQKESRVHSTQTHTHIIYAVQLFAFAFGSHRLDKCYFAANELLSEVIVFSIARINLKRSFFSIPFLRFVFFVSAIMHFFLSCYFTNSFIHSFYPCTLPEVEWFLKLNDAILFVNFGCIHVTLQCVCVKTNICISNFPFHFCFFCSLHRELLQYERFNECTKRFRIDLPYFLLLLLLLLAHIHLRFAMFQRFTFNTIHARFAVVCCILEHLYEIKNQYVLSVSGLKGRKTLRALSLCFSDFWCAVHWIVSILDQPKKSDAANVEWEKRKINNVRNIYSKRQLITVGLRAFILFALFGLIMRQKQTRLTYCNLLDWMLHEEVYVCIMHIYSSFSG